MNKVLITRKIPENGIAMLRDKGYEVDVNPADRPLSREEVIEKVRAKPYDAVLTQLSDKIDGAVFDAVPSAKIFANYAIGFDNFDVEEGKKRGIFLTNTPGGGADRVAEHAWGLIFALTCRIVEGDRFVKGGHYNGWNPMVCMGSKVKGKVLGLVGAGHIGAEVARIGSEGFGMRVVYTDVERNQKIEDLHTVSFWPTLDDVLKQADIVSLHVPLNDSTRHLINAEKLKIMKKTAYLINTARGPIIDEAALVEALKTGVIAGAGLDVLENEPKASSGLLDLPNVVITPHIASCTEEARIDMARIAATNIITALDGGKPRDMVYN